VVHLVWNLWAGFSWSAPFERVMGPVRFLVVYLLSGIAGSALSVIGHDAVSAGASGALFGVLGGTMVLQRRLAGSWATLWAAPEFRRSAGMTALWLVIGPFVGFDSFAHLGGMLAGAALTWTMTPVRWGNLGAVLAAVALLAWISTRPIPGLHDDFRSRQRATEAIERKDWKEAVEATNLLPTPVDPHLVSMRVFALVMLNRGAEAEPLLHELRGPPTYVAALRAQVHTDLGKYPLALEDVRVALAQTPKDEQLRRTEVWVLLASGANRKADERAEALLVDAPRNAEWKALRMRTLAASFQFDEALSLLAELKKDAPGQHGQEIAMTLAEAGRIDEARAALAGVEPDTRARLVCSFDLLSGEFDAAAASCADPANPWLTEFRAALAVAKGDCEGARAMVSKPVVKRFPRMIEAACLAREKKLDEAHAVLDALTLPDEPDPELLLLRLAAARDAAESEKTRAELSGWAEPVKRTLTWRLVPEEVRAAF
ncbi:MAG TPA: rhomboid family intramembrane serine protease, partial [Archangium sp.]